MMVMTDDDGSNRKLSLAFGSGPHSDPKWAPSGLLGFAHVFATELLIVRGVSRSCLRVDHEVPPVPFLDQKRR